MDFVDEQVPPKLQVLLKMIVAGRRLYLMAGGVVVLSPWLRFADEVEDFDVAMKSKIEQKLNFHVDLEDVDLLFKCRQV